MEANSDTCSISGYNTIGGLELVDANECAVCTANTKIAGVAPPDILSPELIEVAVAQGSIRLENTSALTSYYGYNNDLLAATPDYPRMLPASGAVPSPTVKIEATKTE